MKSSLSKLKLGNINAHNFETKDTLINIFKIIDPDNGCTKVIENLQNIKADEVLAEIVSKREEYYYDKFLIEQEENNILKNQLSYDKFCSIFVN